MGYFNNTPVTFIIYGKFLIILPEAEFSRLFKSHEIAFGSILQFLYKVCELLP